MAPEMQRSIQIEVLSFEKRVIGSNDKSAEGGGGGTGIEKSLMCLVCHFKMRTH